MSVRHSPRHTLPQLGTHCLGGCLLGCFSKDTLKKNKMFTPARYWGAPRKSISRRRDWSNKSRGLPKALKVWKKITPRRNRRRPLNWLRPQNFAEQVLLLVFSMQSPCSCGHFEMRLTYEALSVAKLRAFEKIIFMKCILFYPFILLCYVMLYFSDFWWTKLPGGGVWVAVALRLRLRQVLIIFFLNTHNFAPKSPS